MALWALSLVEKAEWVQVRFALHLRDQPSTKWMHEGCEVYVDSYMASNGSCFKVTWTIFIKHLLEVGLTQKLGDHGTPNAHICWFIIFYHVWRPCLNINSSNQHLVEGLVTYDFTLHLKVRDHNTQFWRCLDHLLEVGLTQN